MEKVLEKLKTENGSLKLVADELIKQCEKEPAFIDKILNEKKTLNDCWEYVKSRAKKEAQDGCAVIDNETVYGWAIHYFDEEELEDWKPAKARVEATAVKKDKIVKAKNDEDSKDNADQEELPVIEDKPKLIKKQKGVAEGQISLFDF